MREQLKCQQVKANTVGEIGLDNNLITITNEVISLTTKGLEFTQTALENIIKNTNDKIERLKDDFL